MEGGSREAVGEPLADFKVLDRTNLTFECLARMGPMPMLQACTYQCSAALLLLRAISARAQRNIHCGNMLLIRYVHHKFAFHVSLAF